MSDLWRQSLDLEGHPAPPVLWTRAAPSDDVHSLGRWSAAVGPARVGNAAAGCAARWPLTVAVWNANVGAGAMHALWDSLTEGEGAAARPTVVLLQEVFAVQPDTSATGQEETATPDASAAWARRIAPAPPGEPRTDIVSFAREAGLSLVYVPSMRNGHPARDPPEDRGNAVLANVSLASPTAIELPFERQRRVAVTVEAGIADTTVTVCSVHLDNRVPWRRAWRSLGGARRRQMEGLLTVFPASGDAVAHVLGGDLNTWVGGRREGAYRLARERFPMPRRVDRKPTHHFEIGNWLRHSDHLLFGLPAGWHAEYRRLDDTFGSDHYPLVGIVGPARSTPACPI